MRKNPQIVCCGRTIRLCTDFDGGALALAIESDANVFDCWPYSEEEYVDGFIELASSNRASDKRDGANFCFFFKLDGCQGQTVTLRFHVVRERSKAKDVSVVYANPDFPVFSYDRAEWERFPDKELGGNSDPFGERTITVRKRFLADVVWIAFQYPYTHTSVTALGDRIRESPFCEIEVAGQSTEGRTIPQITVTDPAVPLRDKKVAWFIGLQHPAEYGAGWGLEGMIEALLSATPLACEARKQYEFKMIPVVNVDAVAEGRGRIHSSGRNLNREWETDCPVTEVRTIRETLDRWTSGGRPIDVFIDFHGFSAKEGRWVAPILPPRAYQGRQSSEYVILLDAIRKHLPQMQYLEAESEGYAAGAACRRYGALSLSVDGYVFRWPSDSVPELSSFGENHCRVWDLKDIKAAGEVFIGAMADFARSSGSR